ncbi:hypothetical protein BPY_16930 [Bifidobacterium psychraerophilum]|uniref:ABC transporter ATP-binding protein n=1 Tax=Bifidobacterium psychraerophilum TaxID=218140 RepID=UPI003116AFFD
MTSAQQEVLKVQNLRVSFGNGNEDTEVVHGISLVAHPGQVHVILGESGSGKTVFARSAVGMNPRHSKVLGSSYVCGGAVAFDGHGGRGGGFGTDVGMIFQDPTASLDPMYRVGDQICEAIRASTGVKSARENKKAALALIESVRIHEPGKAFRLYPHEMSGGMRQRISIAIAMAGDPKLIIADEPSSALDASVGVHVVNLINDLRRRAGSAVLFITHDISAARIIARERGDRVCVMLKGTLVEEGPASEIFDNALHPYTQALLGCEPSRAVERGALSVVPDEIRNNTDWGDLTEVETDHFVAYETGA